LISIDMTMILVERTPVQCGLTSMHSFVWKASCKWSRFKSGSKVSLH